MPLSIHEILKNYWGYDQFRPLQEDIIRSVLDGKDTLALLPTGGGKSVCYQVPALAGDGLCLVVSPLIALIRDQVDGLKKKGIPVLAIYSGMSYIDIRKTLQNAANGPFKFLYVSPERLETGLFLDYLSSLNIRLLAIDEAHCISQWGYDFRPTYLRIANLREHLPGVPVLALTASATKLVQEDICTQLKFSPAHVVFRQSFDRPQLSYSVFNVPSKQNKLMEVLHNVPGTSIVYCKSRKQTQTISDLLNMNRLNADYYHAGLSSDERNKRQESWFKDKTRVMVCTNAFGMGIDKPDVRSVVHYDVPDCMENYYQEAGRAGRDGKRSYAVLLYNAREVDELLEQGSVRFPPTEEIKGIYTGLMNHLQVAAGTGEGMNFEFDLPAFSAAFGFNPLKVTYALKALEQECLICFNEVFFKPSTVIFHAERNDLDGFEQAHPELDYLVKGLLRSYEGILDFPSSINEARLSVFLAADPQTIKADLVRLHELGLIRYEQQKDKPQIQLLMNRMYADNYVFQAEAYLKRKALFEKRLRSMVAYLDLEWGCRSRFITDYFSAEGTISCGICDICISQKNLAISKQEVESITEMILDQASGQGISIAELLKNLEGVGKSKTWKVVDYLVAEKKLVFDEKGKIHA